MKRFEDLFGADHLSGGCLFIYKLFGAPCTLINHVTVVNLSMADAAVGLDRVLCGVYNRSHRNGFYMSAQPS